jgi:hypothetical protein
MRYHAISALLAALALGGCSSSPDGGGATTPVPGEVGRRSVPGYDVVLSREAGVGTYRIDLVGGPPPQAVEAWVACCGYEPDAPATAAQAIAGSASAWRVSVPASGRLWVRITDAGGNVLEAGGDDFPIGP